jgi:pimeloyl-ACP methyl ester carboxylesterase
MPDPRTLVLIHAFPLGARMWAPQLAAFSGWRIITPALPGFDGSAAGTSSMEGFASHINSELDRLGIERAVIGGLSLGGYVTFGVIRQRPERASALILADTRCGADNDEGRAARHRMLALLEQKGPLGVFDEMRPKLFGKTTQAERRGVVEEGKWMVESQSPAAVAGAIRAMLDRPDSAPLLASIRVPTLVLVGDEDTMTPPSESERMHDGIAGSTLVRIPRAGHLSNLEDPAAFNAAVGTFLATQATKTV